MMRDKKVGYWEVEKFAPPPDEDEENDEEDDDEEVNPANDLDLSTEEVRAMRLEREENEEMFADVSGASFLGKEANRLKRSEAVPVEGYMTGSRARALGS